MELGIYTLVVVIISASIGIAATIIMGEHIFLKRILYRGILVEDYIQKELEKMFPGYRAVTRIAEYPKEISWDIVEYDINGTRVAHHGEARVKGVTILSHQVIVLYVMTEKRGYEVIIDPEKMYEKPRVNR
jgi:hypothetical protein